MTSQTTPVTSRYTPRAAGVFLLVGGTVNLLLNMVSEGVYPGYSVGTNALSDMGAVGAPTYLLWNGQLLVTGILSLVGILLLLKNVVLQIPNLKLARVLYVLPPLGTIVVSLFPENTVLALHAVGAFMVFIFGGLGAIYAYRFTKPPFRYLSVVLGIVSLVAISLFGVPSVVGFGVAERLVVYTFNIWVLSFAGYLMAI